MGIRLFLPLVIGAFLFTLSAKAGPTTSRVWRSSNPSLADQNCQLIDENGETVFGIERRVQTLKECQSLTAQTLLIEPLILIARDVIPLGGIYTDSFLASIEKSILVFSSSGVSPSEATTWSVVVSRTTDGRYLPIETQTLDNLANKMRYEGLNASDKQALEMLAQRHFSFKMSSTKLE
jgi:hypothetical protein